VVTDHHDAPHYGCAHDGGAEADEGCIEPDDGQREPERATSIEAQVGCEYRQAAGDDGDVPAADDDDVRGAGIAEIALDIGGNAGGDAEQHADGQRGLWLGQQADEATARMFAQWAQPAEQWLATFLRDHTRLVCGHQQVDVLARQIAAVIEAAGPLGAAWRQRLAHDVEQIAVLIFGIARCAHQHQTMAGAMPSIGAHRLHRQHQPLLTGTRLRVFDDDAAHHHGIARAEPRHVVGRQRGGFEQQAHCGPAGTRQQRQHLAGPLAQAPGRQRGDTGQHNRWPERWSPSASSSPRSNCWFFFRPQCRPPARKPGGSGT